MNQKWGRIVCANRPQNSGHDVHTWVVFSFLHLLNRFFEVTPPWDLSKDLCMGFELEDEITYINHKQEYGSAAGDDQETISTVFVKNTDRRVHRYGRN
jgi:hypothetical protein